MQTADQDQERVPSIPSGYSALKKLNAPWTLIEKNLLRRAGVCVVDSPVEPNLIVVSGTPRAPSIAKVVMHNNFTIDRELPAWFRHPVSSTAS